MLLLQPSTQQYTYTYKKYIYSYRAATVLPWVSRTLSPCTGWNSRGWPGGQFSPCLWLSPMRALIFFNTFIARAPSCDWLSEGGGGDSALLPATERQLATGAYTGLRAAATIIFTTFSILNITVLTQNKFFTFLFEKPYSFLLMIKHYFEYFFVLHFGG